LSAKAIASVLVSPIAIIPKTKGGAMRRPLFYKVKKAEVYIAAFTQMD
jgi:hypothetical protein